MKKTSINIALFPLFLLLLGTVFLNLLSSCSDKDDEDEFVDPQNFCGSYSEDKLSLTLNQNKMPGAQVELVSVSRYLKSHKGQPVLSNGRVRPTRRSSLLKAYSNI